MRVPAGKIVPGTSTDPVARNDPPAATIATLMVVVVNIKRGWVRTIPTGNAVPDGMIVPKGRTVPAGTVADVARRDAAGVLKGDKMAVPGGKALAVG